MKMIASSIGCLGLVAIMSGAHAETKNPIFGTAQVMPTTAIQNKAIKGKGYYADYYGYYGNYWNYQAGYYGNIGYLYNNFNYYYSAQQYATYAANYYYAAFYYQYYGQ